MHFSTHIPLYEELLLLNKHVVFDTLPYVNGREHIFFTVW